jgi:hypothetical protein
MRLVPADFRNPRVISTGGRKWTYIPEAISKRLRHWGGRLGSFTPMAPQGRLTRGVVPATARHGRLFHCTDAVRGCMQRQPRPRAGQATGRGGFVGTAPDTRRPSCDCGALRAHRQCCAPNCHYKAGLSSAARAQKQRRAAASARHTNRAVPLVAWVACGQPV